MRHAVRTIFDARIGIANHFASGADDVTARPFADCLMRNNLTIIAAAARGRVRPSSIDGHDGYPLIVVSAVVPDDLHPLK
jgi:hypothetical protein